jgi:hypothetical protein
LAHDGARQGGALALAAGKGPWFALKIIAEFNHLGRLTHQAIMIA